MYQQAVVYLYTIYTNIDRLTSRPISTPFAMSFAISRADARAMPAGADLRSIDDDVRSRCRGHAAKYRCLFMHYKIEDKSSL